MTPKQSINVIEDLGKLLKEADGDLLRKPTWIPKKTLAANLFI